MFLLGSQTLIWVLKLQYSEVIIFLFHFSPAPSTPPPKEEEWSDIPSEVIHLKDDTFDDFIANNPSVLVMFYAPCKKLSVYVIVSGLGQR